jgi:phosphatidate cytidylyltransferase
MLKARVLTALVLMAVLLALLFAAPPLLVLVAFAAVSAIAGWEWGGLMKQDASARCFYGAMIFFFCWMLREAQEELFPMIWGLSALFWLLLGPAWLRKRFSFAANDFAGYATGVILLVPTWAALVDLHQRGPWVLLAVMAAIWVADIAAYFTGRAFGKTKLAPSISPGKTREGAWGALLAVVVYGLLVWPAVGVIRPAGASEWGLLALALVVLTVLSIMGDLFESLLKRQAGIKDSSNILPGHGGVLDRIDSLTSTLPIVALFLHWLG